MSPHIRDVSQIIEASDHYIKGLSGQLMNFVSDILRLTTNLRGEIGGGAGNTCDSEAFDRKSTIAGVVFALLNDDCRSWTFGSSSEMTNITGSNGSLKSTMKIGVAEPMKISYPCCHEVTHS